MKKILTFFIAIAIISFVANAQNITVSDSIHANVTWSGDTVFVDANIVIDDDVTLTIDPGLVVVFNDFYKLQVKGTIIAEGTENDTIYFTVADTTGFGDYVFNHTGWDGIEFYNSDGSLNDNDNSTFAYCHFSFAKSNHGEGGVFYVQYYNDLVITNSVFEYNYSVGYGGAIQLYYVSDALIDNCTFYHNWCIDRGGAIDLYDCTGSPVISNCLFEGNHSEWKGGAIKAGGYSSTQIINNIL